MKVKKTSGQTVTRSNVGPKEQVKGNTRPSESPPVDIADKVTLSKDAVTARTDAIEEVKPVDEIADKTTTDGPLPDPRATSKAILEKELAQVFKEIYL